MKPVVGITTRHAAGGALPSDGVAVTYIEALAQSGAAVVLLPNVPNPDVVRVLDGLLLTGGGDFAPTLFGAADEGTDWAGYSPERDAAEILYLRALPPDVPVLGICRGLQALAVAFGGSLVQDIPRSQPEALNHTQAEPREATTHTVRLDSTSRLAHIVGPGPLAVNSFHHQAVDRIPAGFRAVAQAPDGLIEAIEGMEIEGAGGRFAIGVQWHPETLMGRQAHADRLFSAFVAACAARSSLAGARFVG
ncbi:MAG: gamma-glutamyl-gamma-aminobutyrate hydrolase family protein [Thermaerobacter sp.]|nr:gamma-glutamyl-gamma-aminobutyrate hydrolase family protein [Thermaerobacter sp.]